MALLAGAVVHEPTARGEVVHVVGDVDRHNVCELEEVLDRVLHLYRDVIIDLTQCRYIGSLGVRLLLRARQRCGGTFETLVRPASSTARQLSRARVDELLGVRYAPRVYSGDVSGSAGEHEVHVITLEGEWDLSRGHELRERLETAVAYPRLVIDMSNVRYMDQHCVGMLVRARTQRVAKGFPSARLVLAEGSVRRVLGVAGFHSLWILCGTLDEAIASTQ